MRTTAIASLFLVAATQTACTYAFDIPLGEVPNLRTGTVVTVEGKMENVSENHTIEPIALDGFVFKRPNNGTSVFNAYPEGSPEADVGQRLDPFKGPVTMAVEGPFSVFGGPDGKMVLQSQWVQLVRVKQLSPGKTAGLVTGTVLGAAPVITIIAIIASISVNGFGVSTGCC